MGERLKILTSGEWDLLAVVAASVLGIILHILHILPEAYIISLILLLLCLHALHEVGQSMKYEETHEKIIALDQYLNEMRPDVEVFSKEHFRRAEEFAMSIRGEMYWFNTPMTVMKKQGAFDRLLKAAIENPKTTKIEFILQKDMKGFFEAEIMPKVKAVKGFEKVQIPIYTDIKESVGFRMIDTDEKEEKKEAHMTFLDEPFTIASEIEEGKNIHHPRFIFHVKNNSELIPKLMELYVKYRYQ